MNVSPWVLALLAAAPGAFACEQPEQERITPMISAPESIRVLTYNIHHGEGLDGRLDLERLARRISEAQPDLVALQEVDQGAGRTGGLDQAAILGQRTGLRSIYGAFMEFDGGSYGMALLSRWEVLRSRNVRLPGACVSCPCNPVPCPEGRTSLVAVVRSPLTRREVVFAGVHLYQADDERLAQLMALEADLRSERAPVILAGDFNSERGTPVMNELAPNWHILEKEGNPSTIPSFDPSSEIDFIVVRRDQEIEVRRHLVLEEPLASDHLPVMAELVLKARPTP